VAHRHGAPVRIHPLGAGVDLAPEFQAQRGEGFGELVVVPVGVDAGDDGDGVGEPKTIGRGWHFGLDWAAGGILAGSSRWSEKSGDGIALGSAVQAADSILKEWS